jgi:hypothetical protein
MLVVAVVIIKAVVVHLVAMVAVEQVLALHQPLMELQILAAVAAVEQVLAAQAL